MCIRVRFRGGPFDGKTAVTDRVDDFKVFFDGDNERVTIYAREECDYHYDAAKSDRASETYGLAREFFVEREPGHLEFDDEPFVEEEQPE